MPKLEPSTVQVNIGCRRFWATPRGGVAPTRPLRLRGFAFFAENRPQPPPKLKLDQCEYQARCLSRFRSPEVPSADRHPPFRRADSAPPAASAEALPQPPPEKYSPASHAVHLANNGGKNELMAGCGLDAADNLVGEKRTLCLCRSPEAGQLDHGILSLRSLLWVLVTYSVQRPNLLVAKCQHYKRKRMEQQETIASLQKDIYRLTMEEEERIITQNRVFASLCKRVPHTVLDRQLLCLIDYYECKIRKFLKQRQYNEDESQSEEERDYRSLDASPTYKGLLMSLQNQLKESKSKIDTLLSEKLNLQKDLEIRLRDLISQNKSEDTEKKDEPSKDNQQQALIDQRYFQDLYKSLKILSAELVPWHNLKKQDENEGIKVEDLLFIVDTMLEEVENKEKDSNMPNFQTLQAIVSHFQKLFDVPSLNGVYPRMNEVYIRLGEMNNAVRNLQELLELDSSSSLCVLVSTVGKLCRLINEDMNEQVKRVLGPEDLQSIIIKLEEHEEFFPAFQAFTNDLLDILEIDDLDAIVPAVKKLKVLSY
ncbi:Centrosomal protein of 70 kDa [Pteropus alecto]|uniref:Centrosomal protein of 70 kDa n=1 Tax=Pteropus alecto TaxID=9402 RepID=L5KZU6_PTEAL|nr:Centrosomal protein of 70 kDa [Pteropus alecto]